MSVSYRWDENVEAMEMDGTWVILHAENNTVTKLNESGGWLWSRLQEPLSFDELVQLVLSQYDVNEEQAHCDVQAFLNELLSKGIACVVQPVHE